MRTRPNKFRIESEHSHWHHNDIYRRFRKEFDYMLQGDSPCIVNGGTAKCYVQNIHIEEKLQYLLDSSTDSIQFFIGRTGIGKSTILRHVFQVVRKPIFKNRSLIVPFSFNGMRMSEQDYEIKLAAIIRVATKALLEATDNTVTNDNLVEFIESHAPDVLMRAIDDIFASNETKVAALRKGDMYSYSLEEFKYCVATFSRQADIDRVIFVVDDIESENQSVQEKIIESMCRLYSCLRNSEPRGAVINILFSVRPVTEKLARRNKTIVAFPMARPIIYKTPVALCDIFRERFRHAIEHIGQNHIQDIDSWKEALEMLLAITERISSKYGESLLKLFNNNIRRTLVEFQMLITNRTWLQKGNDFKASFKLDPDDFSLTQAAILRALGMRNTQIYPAERTCIANIFWNQAEDTYDLLVIYVMLYMLERNESNDHFDVVVETSELISGFSELFDLDSPETALSKVFNIMASYKLIEIERTNEQERSIECIVLQPRARQLWDLLAENSVLLAMYRDDTFQDFSDRSKKASALLSIEEQFDEIFNFLEEIHVWELRRLTVFRSNNIDKALGMFGTSPIYNHIFSGVRSSLYAYYQDEVPDTYKSKLAMAREKRLSLVS